jgi:NAD(P)-dependent dehydrogenase (short-subunit alcohol dehydrogenase family)
LSHNDNAPVINTQPKKDYMNTPTVLITGALTGIGRATALGFARERARVVVSGRRDIAVNNADTEGTFGSVADVTTENYQAIFDTNVLGVLLSVKYEIRAMLSQGKGSIIGASLAVDGGMTAD